MGPIFKACAESAFIAFLQGERLAVVTRILTPFKARGGVNVQVSLTRLHQLTRLILKGYMSSVDQCACSTSDMGLAMQSIAHLH